MSGIWVRPGSTLQIFIVYRLHNRMGGELWIRGCTWLVPKMNTSALSCYESIFFLYINCSPELALGTGFALSGKDSKSHLLFSVDQRSVWLRHSPQKNSPPSLDICECRGSYLCIHVDTPVCFKDGRQDVFLGLLRWVFFRNPVHSYRRYWHSEEVMLWYDSMLTFAQEVEQIWKRKFSMMSLLFVLVRFSSIPSALKFTQPQEPVYLAIGVHCSHRLWVD